MDEKSCNIWLIVMLSFFIVIFVITKTYSYNKYLSYYGQVMKDRTIKVYVLKEDISRLTNNLIVDKKRKYCITSKISTSYIVDNYNKYYEVYYKCDLSNIDNYIFDIKVDLGKTTIMETLKNKIKKGLEL